ncbi:hypothetical protein [Pantoea trifolii]|uniref:Uncharacterized protein n=1 Tax=Pantoea trifolii TaxID=2968030 RepID=A0ABT1VS96_9GAMM|nr:MULTISPECIES: hypothetical protein [unclassified Pantoea]MCQ8230413.1 hypothetical protein [Pantoea sp. MMK2]MCQ8239156.1 hypothetical protein [Pantoea sp. MMK3]
MLNILLDGIGEYERHAQAFCILRKLEKNYACCAGLNLTHRSMLSIIKYPNKKYPADKFLYDEDYAFYAQLLKKKQMVLEEGERTIDAQIMNLAD